MISERSICLLPAICLVFWAAGCDECKSAEDCDVGEVCREGSCRGSPGSPNVLPGNGCDERYLATPEVYIDDLSPSGDPVASTIVLENPGGDTAIISESVTTEEGSTCGRFEIEKTVYPLDFPSDAEIRRTVTFTPDPDGPEGCACFAVGSYHFDLDKATGCETGTVALIGAGRCAEPLYCSAGEIGFSNAVVDSTYTESVTCRYLGSPGETVEEIRLSDGSDPFFTLETEGFSRPLDLATGDRFDLFVSYAPPTPGEHSGEVVLVLRDGGTMRIPIRGSAQTERPFCEDGLPDMPAPELEGDNYLITLEAGDLSFYPGLIRSQLFYDAEPPMISDILVTSGSFTYPECEVSQSGHQYFWSNCDPESGEIHNLHAIPRTAVVEGWIRGLDVGDEVTIVGYEVERVDYDDNRWWTDAGCNTLIITWICDGVL